MKLAAILILSSISAFGAITRVAGGVDTASGVGATATIPSLNCSGANLYIVTVASSTATTPSVSDSQGGSYTMRFKYDDTSSFGSVRQYEKEGAAGGTVTFNATADYVTAVASCYAGAASSSAYDAHSGSNNNCFNGGTGCSILVIPTAANDLAVISCLTGDDSSNITSSGYTSNGSAGFSGGSFYGGAQLYKIKTGSSNENPLIQETGGSGVCGLALYKESTGAPPTPRTRIIN